MLKISVFSKASGTILKLAGLLVRPQVGELRKCWEALRAADSGRLICVDLSEVRSIKPGGKALLDDMRRDGVVIVESHYGAQHAMEKRRSFTSE